MEKVVLMISCRDVRILHVPHSSAEGTHTALLESITSFFKFE